jgi:hypothetical protein
MNAPKHIDPDFADTDLDRAGALWQFHTERYSVAFFAEEEDIDPADSFEFDDDIAFAREDDPAHWFCAVVVVYGPDGKQIGSDVLGGCSYNSFREFYSSHRDRDPANRNTLAMKASNRAICHYFPDMVRQAISDARATLGMDRDGDTRLA